MNENNVSEINDEELKADVAQSTQPLLRVFVFGPLRLEWQVAPSTQEAIWSGRTSARALFLLLLFAPDRQANRSQLASILWPETEERHALESLRSALKILRKVLSTAQGEELLETPKSDLLKLPDQSRLWVDMDAFEMLIEQANKQPEMLSLWQQASAYWQGELLAEDHLHEWVAHRWIKSRRKRLHAARRRMIRHLAQGYLRAGQRTQAEAVLSTHIASFPTDQDALYLLMKLLIEEGCFDEARSQYEQCQRALARYEKQPAKHLQALHEALNTLDITPIVQTTRREFLHMVATSTGMLSTSASQDASETDHELLERLAHTLKKPSAVDTLFLSHLESVTQTNRKRFVLSKSSAQDIRSMYQDASAHLRTITQLLEHPLPSSPYIRLCSLAGETAQLLGDILFHQGKDEEAERTYHTAIQAATAAQNEVLQAVILGRKSFLPLYRGNPTQALSLLRQAHTLSNDHASDTIRAWLLVIEAEAWAAIGNTKACEETLLQSEFLLHQATSKVSTCAFSVEPLYAPLNNDRLLGYTGACYLRLRQPQKAQPFLHTYLTSMRYASIHKQSITLVDLAKTYALQGELEAMAHYVGSAYRILEHTQSTRVFERLVDLGQLVRQWKDTMYVKQFDHQLATFAHARQLKMPEYTE